MMLERRSASMQEEQRRELLDTVAQLWSKYLNEHLTGGFVWAPDLRSFTASWRQAVERTEPLLAYFLQLEPASVVYRDLPSQYYQLSSEHMLEGYISESKHSSVWPKPQLRPFSYISEESWHQIALIVRSCFRSQASSLS